MDQLLHLRLFLLARLILINDQFLVPLHQKLLVYFDLLSDGLALDFADQLGVAHINKPVLEVVVEHDGQQLVVFLALEPFELGGERLFE